MKKRTKYLLLFSLSAVLMLGTCGCLDEDWLEEDYVEATTNEDSNDTSENVSNDTTDNENDTNDTTNSTEASSSNEATEEESVEELGPPDANSLRDISTYTINKEDFSGETFTKAKLTMVNCFATWCSPCVSEMPDLQNLSEDMKEKNVQIIGVVTDANSSYGFDRDAVDSALELQSSIGITYPLVIPDDNQFHGICNQIEAVPTTFFVDREGHIVGQTYEGARSYSEWESIIEDILSDIGE